ncbi:zinc finger domain-containing protein [Fusarium phyllophilum]|uniref:Zinc finger domain-containing protein n=1 Tax=Fusarium phyllophilum TaxID=47803 RepID=A0A8H5N5A9_9HYPO|nr:zinc finger domain-containing protein [Fusarium phyllophilum]
MSDPLSVTASVVGIVGALLHGSKRLYEFIDSLQNAPKDIAALSTDLRALYEILAHVTNIQDRLSSHLDLCASLKVPLENCLNIFDEFTTLLQGFTQTSRNGTLQVRVWKQMAWAFKDKEIQLFRDTITTYKVSLNMALSAMNFSTIASLNERTKRFETDFREEFKDIKSRLQALDNDRMELTSVAGCKGSEWYGTEANFTMSRFLEYTESLCDSPPASFPGSPTQPLSEDCDELDTQRALTNTASSRQLNGIDSTIPSTGKKYVGLSSETDHPQLSIYPFNPDLPTWAEERMPMWMEDLLLGPADTFIDSESGSPSNTQPGSKTLDPATDQDKEVKQPSTNSVSSPKASLESIHYKVMAQIPTASTPRPKDIYSKSGFDALKVLLLVVARKDPQFNIGQIDMSCSFIVCDVSLEDCPIVYVSDSFQALTGYSRHEVLGRNCRFLQSPDGKVERGSHRPYVDEGTVYSLKTSVEERRETQISMINYRKGGQPLLNFLSIIPIPWDTDEIRYYVGFQIDLVESPIALAPRNVWAQP